MAKKTGNSKTYRYLERSEVHYESLHKDGKMDSPTRSSFFRDFLGCSSKTWINWYNTGTKKIYFCVLDLLDEVKGHRERINQLEKELKEITNKEK